MAKRRKKTSRRRRRVGAIALSASSPLIKYGSIAAGYFMADKLTGMIDQATGGKIDSKITNSVLAAAGLYMLFMHRGRKNTILTVASGLAAGAGAKGLLTDFGVINGFADIPAVGGYRDVPAIGEYAVPGAVGGYNVPQASVLGGVMNSSSGSGINESDR